MRSVASGALFFAAVAACHSGKPEATTDSSSVAQAAPTASAPAVSGKTPCPANGLWSECAVFQALDRAGLAPRRDSASGSVSLAPLSRSGTRLLLGAAELDVFVYPEAAARERDEARLDRSKFIDATAEPTLRGEATLIRNVNLLAVLHSRNDHQRERVSDALSAGPPQATRDSTLPSTRVP